MISDCPCLNFVLYLALFIFGAYFLLKKKRTREKFQNGQKLREDKQEQRKETFDQLEKQYKMTDDYKKIVSLSFDDLINKLQSRDLTAVTVYSAYMAKALEDAKSYNSITEFNPNGRKIAEELDQLEKIKGPLHGLPIAFKEDHAISGMDVTLGISSRLYKPKTESAVVVQIVEKLGAVPFCRTNIPQTEVSYGSENPIYGKTLNPLNIKCATGGSSAGSGSIVSSGGTLVAFGSDIGGSVRIPSAFCGVCGIRPTINRLSGKGITQCLPNCVGVSGVPGPMAKRAKVVSKIFKEITDQNRQNKQDPLTVPLSWNNELFESKNSLRIGYYSTVDFFPSMGNVAETVLEAKSYLEKKGHTLIPFEFPFNMNEMMQMACDIYFSDQGATLKELLEGDEISPVIKGLHDAINTCPCKKRLMAKISENFGSILKWSAWNNSEMMKIAFTQGINIQKSKDLWDLMGKRAKFIAQLLDKMEEDDIDLILCPAFPFPPCKLGDEGDLFFGIVSTCPWNILDFPAGVVPFGRETGEKFEEYDTQGEAIFEIAKESIRSSVNMPIAVQIIAKPFKEELVLRAMVELDENNL